MELNEFQTPITDELLSTLTPEEQDAFYDYINNIEFVRRCISKDRKRAKDLPKDERGRVIVDICNPHILEDMDYFTKASKHFKEHGVYTTLRPNGNRNSEYGKFLRRELDRCWNGYVRESDGEWIPGELYFYWNYTPILISDVVAGTAQADRIEDFPKIWESTYFWAHYMEQAKKGGLYNNFKGGEDAVVIARRGIGKSYFMASVLARIFTIGATQKVRKKVKGLVVAYEKEYLNKDGILNKFVNMIDFLSENTQFPSARLKNSPGDMNWIMGYQDAISGVSKGTLNEILGLSARDNPDKVRGKRSHEVIYEEFGSFPKFLETWVTSEYNVREGDFSFGRRMAIGCVCADTKIYDKHGKAYLIQDVTEERGILGYKNSKANIEPITYIQDETFKECVEITHSYGTLKCSVDHPILCKVPVRSSVFNKSWTEVKFIPASMIKQNYSIAEIDEIDVWGTDSLFDPYLVGLLIGDGSYGFDKTPILSNCDSDVLDYVQTSYKTKVECSHLTKDGKLYKELRILGICNNLRKIGIYGQTKKNKRLPLNYESLSKQHAVNLIAGIFDTDGCVCRNRITMTQSSKEIQEQIASLLRKLGIKCIIYKKASSKFSMCLDRKSDTFIYLLEIADSQSVLNFRKYIPLRIQYKKDILNSFDLKEVSKNNIRWRIVNSVKSIGVQQVYNLTANDSNTYIANDLVTHNTGGSEGSDFSGALELIYNPKGYHIYGLPNVFDKNAQGKTTSILFLGAYLNRKGHDNKDGVSDIVGALISEIHARTVIKYNSSDPMALTKRKAEMPITLQEAIMRKDSTLYPVADLVDVINAIDLDPHHWDNMWIGKLSINNTEVTFSPDLDSNLIKDFPHKDNKLEGAICIKEMPKTDTSGKVPWGRYVAGIDPYDDDASQTMSLGSLYILDLWTDELVFEYVGRPTFADDFYENCRRALLMYNAECNYENNKKGLFTYFSKHNALFLLSDTLEFLKDKEMMKGNLYGNKSKGTNASEPIKAYSRRCIRDWLLKPVIQTMFVDGSNEAEFEEVTVRNLTHIPFKALLRELSMWNADGNFDRHDALGMLMLIREDKLRLLGEQTPSEAAAERDTDYLGDDDFFKTNYSLDKEKYYNKMSNHPLHSQ